MPNINEMLLKLGGFKYARSLGLNMAYSNIRMTEDESNVCTIILSWVKYGYKRLPMEVINSPEKFQQKMNDLFQ